MTSRLNTMIGAAQRLNRTLDATDALTDTIDPGAPFERSAADIGAASRQVDNFNNRQEQAEHGANRVKSVWSKMGGVIKSALAAFSVKKVVELADGMTTTRARLDLMNDGLQTTAELQDMIMKSANRSRAAYSTTADAVAKMGIMAGDAFSSNEELIAFSELINKQFTIAGTSAAGIDAAMLQLTQAMSSGVLRGEELNSVFEQAPTIIQTIADYLGVPIGKIREMAAEGQITSTIVKNAMLASADEINAKFAAIVENLVSIGWSMLIFLSAYLANVTFSLWYNIKLLHEPFDREKLINSAYKIATFAIGLTLLCVALTTLPLFANEVGWAIPQEYTDLFADLVIIGAVLLVSCKYIKEAFVKFTEILNAGTSDTQGKEKEVINYE